MIAMTASITEKIAQKVNQGVKITSKIAKTTPTQDKTTAKPIKGLDDKLK